MRTQRILLATLIFISAKLALALPASARLFQGKYGYKVSCLLCHSQGGGSAPNSYGKAFLRSGGNSQAFAKIEERDSDEDGIPNLKEILARSNPGKKDSTPTAAGDWLANVGGIYIPEKQLKELFPSAEKFSALEGALNANQSQSLGTKTGGSVNDDDKVPTFYFALKGGKKVSVAQLMTSKSGETSITSGIAVGTNGKIQDARIFSLSKGLSDPSQYAATLKDKDLATLSSVAPKTESEKLLLDSAKRSLALMNIVFGGGK